jgi:hypothetical protein
VAHLTQINFAELTGPQRVVAYNEMAVKLGRPLVKKFENSTKAVARCEALQAILTDVPAADEPRKSVAISKPNGAAKPLKVVVRHALRDERVIKILGPFVGRDGTDKQTHFEKAKGGITVAAYLAKFPEDRRKVARHWLYNLVRDGLVEVR